MTDEIRQLLQRQNEWQKSRQALSWPEKIRMVEEIRESISALRGCPVMNGPENSPHNPRE